MALCKVEPLRTFDGAGKLILELYDPICDCKFPVTRKFVGGKMVWIGDHPSYNCAVTCYRTFDGGKMIWECEVQDTCVELGDDCANCSEGQTPLYSQAAFAAVGPCDDCSGALFTIVNDTHLLTQTANPCWYQVSYDVDGLGYTCLDPPQAIDEVRVWLIAGHVVATHVYVAAQFFGPTIGHGVFGHLDVGAIVDSACNGTSNNGLVNTDVPACGGTADYTIGV